MTDGSFVYLRNISSRDLSKIDTDALELELIDFADDTANEIILDYELTTATWKHDVRFEKLIDVKQDQIEILVGTDDEIYGYVDRGTEPHIIRPVNAKSLAFMLGSKPKSKPNTLTSGRGAPGTPPVVYAKEVHHPGTKARNFSVNITKRHEKKFLNKAKKAIDRAIKRAGLV